MVGAAKFTTPFMSFLTQSDHLSGDRGHTGSSSELLSLGLSVCLVLEPVTC